MHAREGCVTLQVVASYGQCEASLRNGQRCRVVIMTKRAEFCPHHSRLAEEYGAEMVRKGAVPKRRGRRGLTDVAPPIITTVTESTPAAEVALATILTVECPCCGTRSHVEAPVPEVLAQLEAIEHLYSACVRRPPSTWGKFTTLTGLGEAFFSG